MQILYLDFGSYKIKVSIRPYKELKDTGQVSFPFVTVKTLCLVFQRLSETLF